MEEYRNEDIACVCARESFSSIVHGLYCAFKADKKHAYFFKKNSNKKKVYIYEDKKEAFQ